MKDLVTFTKEILNGKVHFCAVSPFSLIAFDFNYTAEEKKKNTAETLCLIVRGVTNYKFYIFGKKPLEFI